jgi:hypothetical protein
MFPAGMGTQLPDVVEEEPPEHPATARMRIRLKMLVVGGK